jgi:hypothetical protein
MHFEPMDLCVVFSFPHPRVLVGPTNMKNNILGKDICQGMEWNIQIIPPFDNKFMDMIIQDRILRLNNVFDLA